MATNTDTPKDTRTPLAEWREREQQETFGTLAHALIIAERVEEYLDSGDLSDARILASHCLAPKKRCMKTREETFAEIERIEADERLAYKAANLQVNGILALEQVAAKARANALRWCLGMPPLQFHGED